MRRYWAPQFPVTLQPYGRGTNFVFDGPLHWLCLELRRILCEALAVDPRGLPEIHLTWKRPPGF